MNEEQSMISKNCRQWFIDYTSAILSLCVITWIICSATLSFWFTLQYAVTLTEHRTIVMFCSYVALISAYYGISPLSFLIMEKFKAALTHVLIAKVEPNSDENLGEQPLADPEPEVVQVTVDHETDVIAKEIVITEVALGDFLTVRNYDYRYSGHDDEEEREEFEEEDALPVDLQILITRHDAASDPNLPSHLFPGCGSDKAKFTVQGDVFPTYSDMNMILSKWDGDCCLMGYDEATGEGRFVMCDSEAPAQGTLVTLKPFSWD